jgi:glyoxylase-like metal-dependent hydrolase (beta-lactamase superfamily II)
MRGGRASSPRRCREESSMTVDSGARFTVGSVEFAVVQDGVYHYDAGAIFGVVPRVMWERQVGELDDQHRIELGLNCLLLRSSGQTILIESGVGGKPGDRDNASPAEDGTLIDGLAALGVTPEDIDIVVNTHLHLDHCGWNTSVAHPPQDDQPEELRPTFPNARYVISAQEWHDGTHTNTRTRAVYLERNIVPVEGQLELADGEHAITDEVRLVPAPGHTDGHSTVVIRSGNEWGVYIGDLVQHRTQLERTAWVSGLDLLPLVSMETKRQLVDECIDAGALVMFSHGPYPGVGRLERTEQGHRRWVDAEPLDTRMGSR